MVLGYVGMFSRDTGDRFGESGVSSCIEASVEGGGARDASRRSCGGVPSTRSVRKEALLPDISMARKGEAKLCARDERGEDQHDDTTDPDDERRSWPHTERSMSVDGLLPSDGDGLNLSLVCASTRAATILLRSSTGSTPAWRINFMHSPTFPTINHS